MRIETLHEFVVLVKHRNFSNAAKELFCSQPNLSNHIAGLEKELGFKLVLRKGNSLSLTPAGLEFLKCAQTMTDAYSRAIDTCQSIAKSTPPVRIQSVPVHSELYRLLQNTKDIPYVFEDLGFDMPLFEAFKKSLLDVGISHDFTHAPSLVQKAQQLHLAWFTVGEGGVSLCLMKSHPLAKKEKLRREDLRGQTIRIHSGRHFDDWKEHLLALLGHDLELSFMLDPIESHSNISLKDLGETLYICGQESIDELLSHRDDVAIISNIEGVSLRMATLLVYRDEDKPNNISSLVNSIKDQLN